VAATPTPAEIRLAQKLRQLRDEVGLTQAALAAAFAAEQPVGAGTVSLWENTKRPAAPPDSRLEAYARFFATARSWEGRPHLVPLQELKPDELRRMDELEKELRHLVEAVRGPESQDSSASPRYWFFDDQGPVTIICPEAPDSAKGPLADPVDPNFTNLHRYADLDALIELHGHIRAENSPDYGVFYKLASEVDSDDLSSHVVLLGGIAWNDVTRTLLRYLTTLPVRQLEDEQVTTGEVFSARVGKEPKRFYPQWSPDNPDVLSEDVALLARVANPFNVSRTLTICNGVHSRGVLGAVRSLTDARLRESNEAYLADRFPDGEFAVLLRVPVVRGAALTPDIRNKENRLWEWSPDSPVAGE
jgi:transcriptional regulator with XRE-family HTH domain